MFFNKQLQLQPVAKTLRHSYQKKDFSYFKSLLVTGLLDIILGPLSAPPSHSKFFLQSFEHGLVLLETLDRPFKPKYGTVSQVLLQLIVARTAIKIFTSLCPNLLGCTFKFDNLNTSEKLETGTASQCSLIRLDLSCVIVYDQVNYQVVKSTDGQTAHAISLALGKLKHNSAPSLRCRLFGISRCSDQLL